MKNLSKIIISVAFVAAIVFLLSACGGGGGGGASASPMPFLPPVTAPAPEAPVVVAPPVSTSCTVALWGDSILYGFTAGGNLPESPADVLRRLRPELTVVDHSVPGDTINRRMEAFLNDPGRPQVIALQFGLNDAAQSLAYEAPLHTLVARAKAVGAKVVITGISNVTAGIPLRGNYDAAAKRVATDEGTAFADWGSVPFTTDELADPFHPGPAYSARLVERLSASIVCP